LAVSAEYQLTEHWLAAGAGRHPQRQAIAPTPTSNPPTLNRFMAASEIVVARG
jgi:hypothetical protein